MRIHIRTIDIGERGSIRIEVEEKWIYPVICLETGQGEQAEILLQHTPVKQLHAIADAFKATAFELSKTHK